jgi:hypothetical protein
MGKTYFFKRFVTANEWGALPRDFKVGEMVEHFQGPTYGLDRDDMMYGNTETIPCLHVDHGGGFFTVPVSMLEDENGKSPIGAYQRY